MLIACLSDYCIELFTRCHTLHLSCICSVMFLGERRSVLLEEERRPNPDDIDSGFRPSVTKRRYSVSNIDLTSEVNLSNVHSPGGGGGGGAADDDVVVPEELVTAFESLAAVTRSAGGGGEGLSTAAILQWDNIQVC